MTEYISWLHCTARCGQLGPRERREANAYARKAGYHSATQVGFTDYWSIQYHIRYGYIKGRSDTYYQPAITFVTVPKYTTPCTL